MPLVLHHIFATICSRCAISFSIWLAVSTSCVRLLESSRYLAFRNWIIDLSRVSVIKLASYERLKGISACLLSVVSRETAHYHTHERAFPLSQIMYQMMFQLSLHSQAFCALPMSSLPTLNSETYLDHVPRTSLRFFHKGRHATECLLLQHRDRLWSLSFRHWRPFRTSEPVLYRRLLESTHPNFPSIQFLAHRVTGMDSQICIDFTFNPSIVWLGSS